MRGRGYSRSCKSRRGTVYKTAPPVLDAIWLKMEGREDDLLRERRVRCVVALVISAICAVNVSSVFGQRTGDLPLVVDGSPVMTVLPKDAIPAIDAPTFVSAREADQMMQPDEPVLGVTDGKVAKAYSLWQLNHHEIVNDQLGTLPIAVTW